MKNRLQIVGDKVYYDMDCVATLNPFSTTSTRMETFKRELVDLFNHADDRAIGVDYVCKYCEDSDD